jgi:hypothetical protein
MRQMRSLSEEGRACWLRCVQHLNDAGWGGVLQPRQMILHAALQIPAVQHAITNVPGSYARALAVSEVP